jgi:hypothetical protein
VWTRREGWSAPVREAPEGNSRDSERGERGDREVEGGGGWGEKGIKNMCGPCLLG